HRALAGERREGGDRDRGGHAQIGAAAGRGEARGVGGRRARRLRFRRLRRVGRLRVRAPGAGDGRAAAALLRDQGRGGLGGRAPLRRRDRRLRRAPRGVTEPSGELKRLVDGYKLTQAIYAAAALGIADLLPRGVEELAAETEAHAPTLRRLLQ